MKLGEFEDKDMQKTEIINKLKVNQINYTLNCSIIGI